MKIALIDADPISYITGWNMEKDRPNDLNAYVEEKFHSIVYAICTQVQATHVRLAFSSSPSFRQELYSLTTYKGNRGPKPAWHTAADSIVQNIKTFASYKLPLLEADDLLSMWASHCRSMKIEYVVCSPDKDLKQVPGWYFNYRKMDGSAVHITQQEADYFLQLQLLTGDSTDNVLGIPGFGEVKAEKLLKNEDFFGRGQAIMNAYIKHFGPNYGPRFLLETEQTLMAMNPFHTKFSTFEEDLKYGKFTETQIFDSQAFDLSGIELNPFV